MILDSKNIRQQKDFKDSRINLFWPKTISLIRNFSSCMIQKNCFPIFSWKKVRTSKVIFWHLTQEYKSSTYSCWYKMYILWYYVKLSRQVTVDEFDLSREGNIISTWYTEELPISNTCYNDMIYTGQYHSILVKLL